MKTVQAVITLPESLYLSLSCFGLTRERIVSESIKLLALKYFQEKLLSMGKAAELSGLSKLNFIEYLSSNNVPVIDYDDDKISREFEVAENIAEMLASENLYSRSGIQRSDGRRRPESRRKNRQGGSMDYKKNRLPIYTQANLLMTVLDKGESEVLVLAKEMQADLVLPDEEKARKRAVRAGFKVMGLIGILIAAKRLRLITDIRKSIETRNSGSVRRL